MWELKITVNLCASKLICFGFFGHVKCELERSERLSGKERPRLLLLMQVLRLLHPK